MNSNNEIKISPLKEMIGSRTISEIPKLEDIYYIIDYKNKLEHQNSINKDRTLSFHKSFIDEDSLNQSMVSMVSSNNNNSGSNYIDSNVDKLISQFILKLFPNCKKNWFHICVKLSSEFFAKSEGKYDKDKLENSVNYIFSNKENYCKLNHVKFDFDFIQNFGYIIMASYSLFKSYKINEKKELRSNIKLTLRDKTNVINDFLDSNKGKNSNRKKTQFWDKNARNYYIPGIYIFLINVFREIENIEINLEEYNSKFADEDFQLFAVCVYNLEIIFSKINSVKVNFNNKIIQEILYNSSSEDLMTKLKNINNNIKYRIINSNTLYNTKLDFKSDFLINDNKKESKIIAENNIGESKTSLSLNISNISNMSNTSFNTEQDKNKIKDKEKNEKKITPESESKEPNIENQIQNYAKMILLCIYNLNKIKEINDMDLILNDSYSEEINNCFKKYIFESDDDKTLNNILSSKIKDFHLFDLIFGKLIKLKTMNFEFNSLDSATFTQVLKFIYLNNSLTSLNISFFTSDVFYLQQSLFKLYNNIFPDTELNLHCDIEKNILEKILPLYSQCLKNFFETLKSKKFQNLGIYMDIPDVVENNKRYMLLITKFILDILLYVFNKENNKLETVKILCPKLILNNEYCPFINKIFSEIKKYGYNNIIKEFNFKAQLYKVINIKNLLCESLCVLNIGNCDVVTFKSLVGHLSSYKFSKNSNLKKISLGLIKIIRKINDELKNLLMILFSVKIKYLIELNIYSNIIINKATEYLDFLNIFKNTWISKSIFTLNEKSENIINEKECEEKRNNIKYLIQFNSEGENLEQQDIDSFEIFWIIKYLFQKKYTSNKDIKEKESIFIFFANNILSYNYPEKNMVIQHHNNEVN